MGAPKSFSNFSTMYTDLYGGKRTQDSCLTPDASDLNLEGIRSMPPLCAVHGIGTTQHEL